MNSFGICFLPDVVTRYRVKSSILRTTQEVISFCRLSSTRRLAGESGTAPPLCTDELLLPDCGIVVDGFEAIVDPLLLPGGVCGGVDGTFDDLIVRKRWSSICISTRSSIDYRSRGACDAGRLGWLRFSNDSRNELRDCSSHRAGGTAASLYLWRAGKSIEFND